MTAIPPPRHRNHLEPRSGALRAEFKVRHMMISNVKASSPRSPASSSGRNRLHHSKSRPQFPSPMFSTGDDQRDAHLKSADFFGH